MERYSSVYKYTIMAVLVNGIAVKINLRENERVGLLDIMDEIKEREYRFAVDSYDNAIVVDTKYITHIEVLKEEVE